MKEIHGDLWGTITSVLLALVSISDSTTGSVSDITGCWNRFIQKRKKKTGLIFERVWIRREIPSRMRDLSKGPLWINPQGAEGRKCSTGGPEGGFLFTPPHCSDPLGGNPASVSGNTTWATAKITAMMNEPTVSLKQLNLFIILTLLW